MSENYLDWKRWVPEDFGVCNAEDALYFAEELRLSGIASVSGLDVGELGYGNGSFAGWARMQGAKWVGLESSVELQERARLTGYEVLEAGGWFSTSCGTESLDLVVAF